MKSLLGLAAAAAAAHGAAAINWVHPGVLVSPDRLADIKAMIANGTSPYPEAFAQAQKSKYAALDWKIQGPPADGIIECGSYSKPDIGCTWESDDGAAAYLQALLYHLTGTQAYAAKSMAIMDAYANVVGYTDSNAPLQSAWGGSKWSRAAELIIHSDAGWPAASQARFLKYLTDVIVPLNYAGSRANGNWALSMWESLAGIAVVTENATLLQHAADMWTRQVPAYYYLATDGPTPIPPPLPGATWYGETVFNASVNGMCQETCRDFGHTSMGTAAAFNAATTLWVQGLDVLGPMADRLTAAFAFHAPLLLGTPPPSYLCGNGTIHLAHAPTWEVGYWHLVGRLGKSLPLMWTNILQTTRATADPVNNLMMIYETLTHGVPGPTNYPPASAADADAAPRTQHELEISMMGGAPLW